MGGLGEVGQNEQTGMGNRCETASRQLSFFWLICISVWTGVGPWVCVETLPITCGPDKTLLFHPGRFIWNALQVLGKELGLNILMELTCEI